MLTKWGVDHPWVQRGTAFCRRRLEEGLPTGFDDFRCAIAFLEKAGDRELAESWLEQARSHLAWKYASAERGNANTSLRVSGRGSFPG